MRLLDPISGPAAQQAAEQELHKGEYHRDDPDLLQRALNWLGQRLSDLVSGSSGTAALAVAVALIAAGLDPQTPAATVADGGLPSQRTVRAPLHRIAEQTSAAGLRSPAVVVIGSVAAFDPAATS